MSKFWSEMARRTDPYIPGEQINDVLKLNTNENPYPPSPNVMKAISKEVHQDLRLYPSPTMDQLKESIAANYQLSKENVFVGNGSDEVLAFSFMAFFDPGKSIRFPEITYSFYPVYANLFDIPYEQMPLNKDFSIRVEDYYNSDGGVIFPNPNAPTSIYLPLEHVEDIIQQNLNRVVIVDEAYIDFAGQSASTLIHKYENVLVIQTMSKSRSLAGLRVGFALGDEGLIEGLTRMKDSFNSYPVDRLAMAGAEAAIKDTDYYEKTTEKIIATRTWVSTELEQLGFHVLPSAANFVFATHNRLPAEILYKTLKANKILIRYFGKKPIENYVRITIGTDDEMKRFVENTSEIIRSYSGES